MSAVLIVGAGMAGIACARALQAGGVTPLLLDKGRGIGGRMATRRVALAGGEVRFDHGAQYLSDSDAGAAEAAARAPGAVARWQIGDGAARRVGQPGMSGLARALATGLDVRQQVHVTGVSPQADGWRVTTEDGAHDAARVVLTVPAPQLAGILADAHPVAAAVACVTMQPCLTLMAAFPPGAPTPFVTEADPDAALSWIAQDSRKPGRDAPATAWVAQAGPGWSAARIDADRTAVAEEMLALLCARIGAAPGDALHCAVHGWRYARTETPLGRPFVQDGTLYAGGDWCLGDKVGHAWRAGTAMAEAILAARTGAGRARQSTGM